MNITKKHVFLFWGVMDILYLLRYMWLNLSQHRIPLYDDIISFSVIYQQYSSWAIIPFSLSLLLTISIVMSAVLFLKRAKHAALLGYLQIPFRLFLVVPSLSFIPWFINVSGLNVLTLSLFLLIVSEIVKILTIYFYSKKATH